MAVLVCRGFIIDLWRSSAGGVSDFMKPVGFSWDSERLKCDASFCSYDIVLWGSMFRTYDLVQGI